MHASWSATLGLQCNFTPHTWKRHNQTVVTLILLILCKTWCRTGWPCCLPKGVSVLMQVPKDVNHFKSTQEDSELSFVKK